MEIDECINCKMVKVGLERQPVTEETDYAIINFTRVMQVNRCLECGKMEKNLLWGTKKKIEWKDSKVDDLKNFEKSSVKDWETR